MTVITRTLYEEYPDINAVGLCHEVFSVQDLFADLVEEHRGVESVAREEIQVNVKGINHFTWVDDAHWRGESVYDLLEEWVAGREDPPRFEPGDLDEESYFVDHDDITHDLYRTFGILPAAGDRHLAEFVPWYLNVEDDAAVQRWGIRLTPSEYRVNHWPDADEKRQEYLDGEDFEFYESGEEAVEWMQALLGIEPLQTHANLPNRGQCPDLQEGAVVETNVLVTGDSVAPLTAGTLPPQVRSLVSTHVTNQETLVEAGFEGDVDRAFRAFLNEPLVDVDTPAARELFNRMVEAEREYLSGWNLSGSEVLDERVAAAADD